MTNEIEKNWWVFPGFKIEHVVAGLNLPVNIVFVEEPKDKSDAPLFYVTELYGQIKAITNDYTVYTYAENLLNYEPDYTIPGSGESGVTGICIEPETGDLFVSMIYADGDDAKAKVIRTKSDSGLKMDSMETVIDNIPSIKGAHQIQSLTIGSDGKLYVNMGDAIIEPHVAQDDNDLRGKVLRMNLDGSIPEDNPNKDSLVYAKGFRNPFGGVWRQKDDSLYITDNGPFVDDRVAKVEANKDYGWPDTMRKNSLFWWNFTQAPTAIDFMEKDQFSFEYEGDMFVALFGGSYQKGMSPKGKKIVKMTLNEEGTAVKSYDDFLIYTGKKAASPCALAFGNDGLYFSDLYGESENIKETKGNIYKIVPMVQEVGEKKVPYTRENYENCLCPNCPTYNECTANRSQRVFCSKGKTECDLDMQACLCGECPVASQYRLSSYYYCMYGSADEVDKSD